MSSRSHRSTDSPTAHRSFHVESLGCAKNQVDSELMIAALERAGWSLAEGPADADVLIVNTCGFINAAKTESIETTLELKARHPGKRVVMVGCLSERYGEQLRTELPEIDGFLGNRDPERIVELVEGAPPRPETPLDAPRPYDRTHLLSYPGSAYVKVAEGCGNRCTYCAIPRIRGDLSSREPAGIVEEIRGLVDRGTRELILIAQDLGSYGKDLGTADLAALLESITRLPGDFWVRMLYIHPEHFPDRLLDLLAADRRLLPYFDLPFQHASPRILRAMGRRGDTARNLELVQRIRARLPGAAVRSTFLVGFPGETDEDFQALCDFQDAAHLDWLGAFAYSREEDTPAYDMTPRVGAARAEARKSAVEERQIPITAAALEARVGQVVDVLVEERIEGEEMSIGRAFFQAPDVDGLIVVQGNLEPGTVVPARLIRRNGVDLEAERV